MLENVAVKNTAGNRETSLDNKVETSESFVMHRAGNGIIFCSSLTSNGEFKQPPVPNYSVNHRPIVAKSLFIHGMFRATARHPMSIRNPRATYGGASFHVLSQYVINS